MVVLFLIIGLILLIISVIIIVKVFRKEKIVFNVGDRVYMDSQFGRYTGNVTKVDDKNVTIQSFSPGGRGNFMVAEYNIKNIEWKKLNK